LIKEANALGSQVSLPRAELTAWSAERAKVTFVILFGSFVPGHELRVATPHSDVDIAVHTEGDLTLLERGAWIADLELLCGRAVDLVWLNPLPAQNPALAYEIVTEGQLLFCRERARYVGFRTAVTLRYLDTAYLREQVAAAFRRHHVERRS
jgi:predicted nucleotidyltransferase